MTRFLPSGVLAFLLLGLWISLGCQRPNTLNHFYNTDPFRDQRRIVATYYRQAVFMVKNAEDLSLKAKRYAQLFGPDSNWVTSANFLEKYYEKESLHRERLAILHAELARAHSGPASREVR